MAGQPQWLRVGGNAAERYERDLVPAMFAAWAPILVDAARVQPGEHVLDVACGTGVVARLAAERVGDSGWVVGLDVNAAMLAVGRDAAGPSGASIEWCEASALEMPLPDGVFEVVLCQQGLQQFPDRPVALSEMRRVLRPGGRLAASVWASLEQNPGFVALVGALERHVGDAAANNRRAPFALGDAGEVDRLVRAAGFRDVSLTTLSGVARFPSTASFVEAQLAASPLSTLGVITDETVGAVVHEVSTALQPYTGDDGCTFPMAVHLLTAHI
jgi:SAM-dependent methyltransferase